ncbi:MAG: ribosome silencing factor [Chloroflexota bacterium]
MLETIEQARKAVDVASEKQATDILLLDIRKVTTFADFFVIMTAESRRQMDVLSQDMEQVLKGSGAALHHREGTPDSGWLLLDFGDVIVHLFAPEERAFYQLEELWSKGQQVVRIQ